ncbi:carbonic anhydrase [Corynebacterium incognita]|uniref:Carbonic anhydrase n=1 Tax=Corynebacterium incognita TaxID=2754725 RepID=A0A7G7CRE1_9CORY|nr:carbonic anhydrase [Corynebacterium incognita]QNE90157.1 carbonic anhydrase [Corynebacterium incognita]
MTSIDSATTPQHVWDALKEGNARFAADNPQRPNTDTQRRSLLVEGQDPRVVVLSCSDSRVPAELVFDLGLGDAFVIRTAGQVLDNAVLASVEFAVENLGASLLVVMGHESCGAVKATAGVLGGADVPQGYQRTIVEQVALSTKLAQRAGSAESADVEREHVVQIVELLRARSPKLQEKLADGSMGIVGLRYLLGDGKVEEIVLDGVA